MHNMNEVIYPPDESIIDLSLMEEKLALAKKIAKWNGAKSVLVPLVKSLVDVGLEPTFDGQINLNFSGYKEKLAQVMRIVRTSGWVLTADRPKKGDSSWYSNGNHPGTTVAMSFYFTSSVCKRVKTGTKMVEQDVYEVRCGDDLGETECVTEVISATESMPALTEIPS
jgi:hypothetical protein